MEFSLSSAFAKRYNSGVKTDFAYTLNKLSRECLFAQFSLVAPPNANPLLEHDVILSFTCFSYVVTLKSDSQLKVQLDEGENEPKVVTGHLNMNTL